MATLSGYSLTCSSSGSVGGIKALKILRVSDLGAVTEASDIISAIARGAGTFWAEYQFKEETAVWTETAAGTKYTTVFNENLEMALHKKSQTLRDSIMELFNDKCGLVVAIQDMNDVVWIWGEAVSQRAFATAGTGTTGDGGTLESDSQETITITAKTTEKAKTFSGDWDTDLPTS